MAKNNNKTLIEIEFGQNNLSGHFCHKFQILPNISLEDENMTSQPIAALMILMRRTTLLTISKRLHPSLMIKNGSKVVDKCFFTRNTLNNPKQSTDCYTVLNNAIYQCEITQIATSSLWCGKVWLVYAGFLFLFILDENIADFCKCPLRMNVL